MIPNTKKPEVKASKSILGNIGVQSSGPSAGLSDLAQSLVDFFFEPSEAYDMEEVIKEYKALNEVLISAMEALSSIFSRSFFNAVDFKILSELDLQYKKRHIRKKRKDNLILNKDILSNILHSTLTETYKRSIYFFGSNDVSQWDYKLNQYRNFLISFEGKHVVEMIAIINTLHASVLELHKDYNTNENSFQENFNFNAIVNYSDEIIDLDERKAFLNLMILTCNKMCLSGQIILVDKKEQTDFIRKCQIAIENINFEKKNFGSVPSIILVENEDKLIQVPVEIPLVDDSLPEVDITLNRQFLAAYYMLNAIDNQSFSRNKSEMARFIQMLTGKSYHNIYKSVKNPLKDPSERTSKKHQEDIHFLVDSFRKLGLLKIANTVENDNLIG